MDILNLRLILVNWLLYDLFVEMLMVNKFRNRHGNI